MRATNVMRQSQRGITLIELMVVIVIVGILAAIAYPSYRQQVMRSNRTEAKVALEQRALALEKCFTRYLSYESDECTASTAAADGETPDRNYSVALASDAESFTVTATAINGQAADQQCDEMTIDERGRRLPAECW